MKCFLYPRTLEKVKFLKRYKRFFVDVERKENTLAVHCANSGSMQSCLLEGASAFVLDSQNPSRKLQYSLELIELTDGLACVNTQRANEVISGLLSSLKKERDFEGLELFDLDFQNIENIKREAKFSENTRFDFLVNSNCWVEVKSVSLRLNESCIAFPDAKTERGQKHLQELSVAIENGTKAFLFFAIMRGQSLAPFELAQQFKIASEIDKNYGLLMLDAVKKGVEVRLVVADVALDGLGVRGYFKFKL